MGNYDPNCWACRFIVYGTPFVASALVSLGVITRLREAIPILIIALLIGIPTSIWIGKRMPMLHEYFK